MHILSFVIISLEMTLVTIKGFRFPVLAEENLTRETFESLYLAFHFRVVQMSSLAPLFHYGGSMPYFPVETSITNACCFH